jgi:hypothetical protein
LTGTEEVEVKNTGSQILLKEERNHQREKQKLVLVAMERKLSRKRKAKIQGKE